MATIDLNADLGEGFAEADRALIELATSASVACGAHAGGEDVARALCGEAAARGVTIGAHVGYPDRAGFGRHELGLSAAAIEAETASQIEALSAWAAPARVAYLKPHGALYHRASIDAECAAALVRAAAGAGVAAVLAFPGSELLEQARAAGLTAAAEGFADRGYAPDGSLVPRGEPGDVLAEDAAASQALRLARGGSIDSLCLHGDSAGAAALARRVRAELTSAGVELRAFA
ncbi:MAG TPA: LamB/YcsF family protein [Gaiellaceae bacterium]|nr:LamB/YcsF family protein [Gaiellaceae bacterium]